MNKRVELPIIDPIYGTYHHQGSGCAIIAENPSIRNWYLNQAVLLRCGRHFLYGYTAPDVSVIGSRIWENPLIERKMLSTKLLGGAVNTVIKNLIDDGYYVSFDGVDDYYVKGKSWYHERHSSHDGLICGYDREDGTYTIFAYDSQWVYRTFKTPQKCLDAGRNAEMAKGNYGSICGLKPKSDIVELEPKLICSKLREYLDSSLDKYPLYIDDVVFGTAVHDYVAMYVNKLADGSIPHEKMDRRVFRAIWEHKKVMLERICAVEKALDLDGTISVRYRPLVRDADSIRVLYAVYHMKKRDSVLPTVKDKLIEIKNRESELLREFISQAEGAMK